MLVSMAGHDCTTWGGGGWVGTHQEYTALLAGLGRNSSQAISHWVWMNLGIQDKVGSSGPGRGIFLCPKANETGFP